MLECLSGNNTDKEGTTNVFMTVEYSLVGEIWHYSEFLLSLPLIFLIQNFQCLPDIFIEVNNLFVVGSAITADWHHH